MTILLCRPLAIEEGGGMSVAKLLLSGLLVASGLILGAFTLHGYFDPQWLERQAAAAGQRMPASEAKWVTSVQDRSRVMSVVAKGAEATQPAKTAPKADAKSDAKPPSQADADAEKAKRRLAAKKLAEKRKTEEAQKAEKAKESQQATFQWPWNWFSN
jgi:hypothetical protein